MRRTPSAGEVGDGEAGEARHHHVDRDAGRPPRRWRRCRRGSRRRAQRGRRRPRRHRRSAAGSTRRAGRGAPPGSTRRARRAACRSAMASMAARAAVRRSTASGNSYSGRSRWPVLSSIERPATPAFTQAATCAATPSGVPAKPGFEVGVHRKIGGLDDGADVGERGLEPGAAVGRAVRPRAAGARGRQRLEAELLQVARGTGVPGVGNDEAARLVQPPERAAALGVSRGVGGHGQNLPRRPGRRFDSGRAAGS